MTQFTKTRYTTQFMQNWGFDDVYKVPSVEGLVYNPVTNSLDRLVQPGQTIPTTGTNPITALDYDGVGNLQYITKTINGVDYKKTLTYDGVGNLTDISAWVQL